MLHARNAPWFRERGYAHFDAPLSLELATRKVSDPAIVARHSFWPLLAFKQRSRVWKDGPEGTKGKWVAKLRPIAFAAHLDSHIFAYYAYHLQSLYEAKLMSHGLSRCVLAYRRIVRDNGSGRGKTNYDFAAEAFADVATRETCEVVALDIKSFFDTIPHSQLKKQWKSLLASSELPPDQFAVFKASTRHAQVSLKALRKRIGLGLRQYRKVVRIPITAEEFRKVVRGSGLVKANTDPNRPWGIPQGLPISGLLANLVMFDIDRQMHAAVSECGGAYRRYSDDILIITPIGRAAEMEKRFIDLLTELPPLAIQPLKTAHSRFERDAERRLIATKPVQYLGFEFDGKRVLVRPQTLARYSKRMGTAVRQAARAAAKAVGKGKPFKLRKRDLLARFSHLEPHPETPKKKRPRGSFYKYGRRAEAAMDAAGHALCFQAEIKRQLKRSVIRLAKLIMEAENGETR